MKVFVSLVALSVAVLFTTQTSAEEANTKDENVDRSLYGFGFVRPWLILGPYYAVQQSHSRPQGHGQAVEAKLEAGQAIVPQRPVVEAKTDGLAIEAKQADLQAMETNEDTASVMEATGGDGLDGFRMWFFRPIYRPILVGSILASQGGQSPGGNYNVNGNNDTVVNAEIAE